MAATFAAQIRRGWDWHRIEDAIDNVIEVARDLVNERGLENVEAEFPIDARHGGITAHAEITYDGPVSILASVMFGTVMNIVPSGSFYAPWSAIPESVRDRDARWWSALEQVANRFGLHVENGEGDPTDVFVTRYADINDPADLALMPDDIGAK